MAIYGIGAYYDGETDVSGDFIEQRVACVGWTQDEAPTLHNILRCVKIGDIMYIKSAPIGQGLYIKAVGIVTDNTVRYEEDGLGARVSMNWIWTGMDHFGVVDDKYNVRNITLYEEFSREVQSRVLELLFSRIANS